MKKKFYLILSKFRYIIFSVIMIMSFKYVFIDYLGISFDGNLLVNFFVSVFMYIPLAFSIGFVICLFTYLIFGTIIEKVENKYKEKINL